MEIAANADPPVAKVIDMGKFLFEQTKKERLARKAQTKIEVKEIRLRPKTNVHHRGFKVEDARRWLEHGMKVRVTIKFRGREITYPEIALEDLKEIAEALKDVSKIEASPSMEGKSMTLVLAPDKTAGKKPDAATPEKLAAQAEKTEAPKIETPAKPEKAAVMVEKVETVSKPEKKAVKAGAAAKPEKAAKAVKAE